MQENSPPSAVQLQPRQETKEIGREACESRGLRFVASREAKYALDPADVTVPHQVTEERSEALVDLTWNANLHRARPAADRRRALEVVHGEWSDGFTPRRIDPDTLRCPKTRSSRNEEAFSNSKFVEASPSLTVRQHESMVSRTAER
jgi:hypothetical protein